jgi:hypothetical protein
MSDSVSDTHDSAHPLTFGNLFGSMRGVEFAPSDYERGYQDALDNEPFSAFYDKGQRDMLAKCIEAVQALVADDHRDIDCDTCAALDSAINALRALQEKP